MTAPDCLGYPWSEAEKMLRDADIQYVTAVTRPTGRLFRTDGDKLFVLRQRKNPDGQLELILGAKCLGATPKC